MKALTDHCFRHPFSKNDFEKEIKEPGREVPVEKEREKRRSALCSSSRLFSSQSRAGTHSRMIIPSSSNKSFFSLFSTLPELSLSSIPVENWRQGRPTVAAK